MGPVYQLNRGKVFPTLFIQGLTGQLIPDPDKQPSNRVMKNDNISAKYYFLKIPVNTSTEELLELFLTLQWKKEFAFNATKTEQPLIQPLYVVIGLFIYCSLHWPEKSSFTRNVSNHILTVHTYAQKLQSRSNILNNPGVLMWSNFPYIISSHQPFPTPALWRNGALPHPSQ